MAVSGILLGAALTAALLVVQAAKQPNVVFFVVDDLTTTLSTYGFPVSTPNIERLKGLGVQFSNAYVSVAVCSPSRTAFLTGLRPDVTQVWTIGPYFRNVSRGEGMEVITLPQLFRENGYNSTGVGKIFHPGTPSGGFIKSEGGGDMCPEFGDGVCQWDKPGSAAASWTEPYWFCDQYVNDTVQSPAMQQWPCASDTWPSCGTGCVQPQNCIDCFTKAGTWGVNGLAWFDADCPDECYPEGLIADKAIAKLEYHRDTPETPFFLAVGFKRPHLSYKAPKKYYDLYDLDNISLPVQRTFPPTAPAIAYSHNCMTGENDVKPYGISEPCEANGCHEYVTNDTVVRQLRRGYYASTSLTDHHLGRVLDALEATGLANNTIITFIGDHGYQNGQKGEWCKSTLFELATHIPMFVVPPQGLAGFRRDAIEHTIVESVDLFPTITELAGLPLPHEHFGGESLVPLMRAAPGAARSKTVALSQWPRREECITSHGCKDGGGNPYDGQPADMGYSLRNATFRYTYWCKYDWNATRPLWDQHVATELYAHEGDTGDAHDAEVFENVNLASDPTYAAAIAALHAELVALVEANLVKPIRALAPRP